MALSDGVFAIAITLLVLQLTVPGVSGCALTGQLLGLYGNTVVAVVFYTLTLALAGTVTLVIWLCAAMANRLIDPGVRSQEGL